MNVTCEFLGRLGNNLFEVAAMIGFCKRTGQQWGIPTGYHHRGIYQMFPWLPLYKRNVRSLPVYDTTHPDNFGYKEIPPHPNGVKLRGFFQSYLFFDHAREEVLKAWNFKKYDQYSEHTSVHIRLGDYVQHSDSFPPVTEDYIRKAFEIIKPAKVLVFSDEINKCREMFNNFEGIEFEFSPGLKEQPNGGRNEYEQLSAMSSCKNNVIANSSFSYCAAYANTNPDKIVVSPHYTEWFGTNAQNLDTSNLLPPTWTQIKFR